MKKTNLFLVIEFFVGCITVGSISWFDARCVNKVLASHVPPPWTLHCWESVVAGLVGLTLAITLGYFVAKEKKARNMAMGFLSFIIGGIICAMFIPARG